MGNFDVKSSFTARNRKKSQWKITRHEILFSYVSVGLTKILELWSIFSLKVLRAWKIPFMLDE